LNEEDPDAELLSRITENQQGAVGEMVARKLPRLLALATRMLGDGDEAKDVAQEVFLRIWKQAKRWKSGQAKFDTWLHRVALNLCYDRIRRRREVSIDDDHELAESVDPAPLPEERIDEALYSSYVADALAALPARQREAIVLQYYQELSNIEAAALMNISVDALESLLSRARRNLRSELANRHGEHFFKGNSQ
jgi:RNA polymerase sigma factor (sigma-70 family)